MTKKRNLRNNLGKNFGNENAFTKPMHRIKIKIKFFISINFYKLELCGQVY